MDIPRNIGNTMGFINSSRKMFQKVKIFSDSCRYGIFQIFIIVLESNEEMYVVRIKLYGACAYMFYNNQ